MSGADYYPSNRPPVTGEPYFPPPPTSNSGYSNEPDQRHRSRREDDQFPQRGAPPNPGPAHDSYLQFPPPPRSEYGYEDVDRARPYAPSEPRPNGGNMLAPYDEEKAYAQYTEAYGPPYEESGRRPPPPRQDEYERRNEDRRRHAQDRRRYDDRKYEGDRRYDDRERYDSRSPYDERERRQSVGYDDRGPPPRRSPPTRGKDILRQGDGERGIGATLLGGAAGAFLGNEMDKGALGTLGGALVGAIGANVVEKQVDKRQQEKETRRKYEPQHLDGGSDPYYGGRGASVRRDETLRPKREGRREQRYRKRRDSLSDGYTSDD